MPQGVADVRGFTQAGQGNDVSVVLCAGTLVGNPNLYTLDGDAATYGGQRLHVVVVTFAEEVREEEVLVLLVVGGAELEGSRLLATLTAGTGAGTLLLADNGLQFQFPELYVGTQTEQAAYAWHQAHVAGERYVTGFNEFDNLVFLAVVLQLHHLRVKVEGSLRIVVQVQVDLVAHLTVHAQVNFLVEVEAYSLTARGSQGRVVHLLRVDTQLHLGTSLRLNLHASRAEDLFGRTQVEVHIRKVELVLALALKGIGILLAPVGLHTVLQRPFLVFFGRHQQRSIQVACCLSQCHRG